MSLARNTASLAALALVAGAFVATGGATAAYAADAVAGAQTAGDSLFPNQGNGGYDALDYDINFRVDVGISATSGGASTTNLPDATATITAKTTGAPLSSYSFDFQGTTSTLAAATLNVDSVTVNGAPATFSRIENTTVSSAVTDNHKLIVTPSAPVDGEFVTVVKYSGRPVIHTDTDGSLEGWNNTVDGASFVNQPIGAMTLFPNNNTPRDKATYTFTIDAPTTLTTSNLAQAGGKPYQAGVVANGELLSRTPSADGTRTTWVWDQKKQMASELSLVSVGRYDIYTSDITLASGRTIPEWTFIDPAITIANQTTTLNTRAQLKAMIDFFETKYGPYPGNSTGLVTDNTTGINYALETQDRPFSPNSASRGTTYHEIAHQWWGDNVSPTDWNDITLNEGPATYTEYQMPYEGAGSTTTTTEQALYAFWNNTATTGNGAATWAVAPAAMTTASQLFGAPTYNKGGMALEALRTSIGAADYETLMRQYQIQYAGGQIPGRRTAAFQALAEQISGRDLTAFFQTWFYTSGKPAWPVKFNFDVAGPTTQVNAGDAVTYTLTARNTGKVAMPTSGTVITVDVADLVDDATLGSLPANVTLDGTTLTWTVPATALAATSTVAIPATVNASATGTLKVAARASTLGGTALSATSTTAIGTAPISPAPVPTITGGTPTVDAPLSADTSGWAAGTTFAYQWYIDGTPVPGATSATYTPNGDVIGFAVTVKVTGTLSGFLATSQTSAATPVGVRATPAVTTPTISGTPKIGVPLTVDPGNWVAGTVFTYSWRANGVAISGATGPRYTPAAATQVGQTLDVVVTATKFGYTTTSRTSAATAAVAAGDPLVLTPTPAIPATSKVGTLITAVPGYWDDGVALTYTWQLNGTNIGGATAATYTPLAAHLGQSLTVTVIGTKPGMTAVSKVSAPTTVEAGTQVLQPTPTITGTPRADSASTGVSGTWDTGSTLTRQWFLDGVAISGATAATYTPTLDQVGKALTFAVTSTRTGYTTVTKTSLAKTIVGYAQTLTPTPTVSGDAQYPETLTVDPGTWDADTTLTQQWFAGGEAIEGATALDYTIAVADIGKTITVAVTSTKPTYETVVKTSDATSPVSAGELDPTPTPTISGTAQVGVELTAVTGTWGDGVALAYQWFAGDEAIEGATASTYTVGSGLVGDTITVEVTGTKVGYAPSTKASEPTSEVILGDLDLTPVPTITGTAKVDVELTAVSGTWTDGASLSYQWFADGESIEGATSSSFTPTADLVGAAITVEVTGTLSGYNEVTKTSLATDAVAKGDFVLAPVPTITGNAKVGVELTAVAGDWDAGTELAFQWFVDGVAVEGASGTTYTPSVADAGSVITVEVTGTKSSYAPVTRASDGTDPVATADLTSTPTPVIRGTVRVGNSITVVPGTWDLGTTLTYQWKRSGAAISGATAATYKVRSADHTHTITVTVTGTKAGYTTVSTTSGGVKAAAGVQSLQPKPVITGTEKVGKTLKVKAASYDTGVTRSYTWFANGVKFGANKNSVKLSSKQKGKRITVRVTATKAGYASVAKTSSSTATIK